MINALPKKGSELRRVLLVVTSDARPSASANARTARASARGLDGSLLAIDLIKRRKRNTLQVALQVAVQRLA